MENLMDSDLFRMFAGNSNQGIGMARKDRSLFYLNPSLKRMLRIDDDEILSDLSIDDLFDEEDLKRVDPEIVEFLKNGKNWTGQIGMKRMDGTFIQTEQNIFPLHFEGEFYMGNIVTDISQLKEVKESLSHEREQASEFMEALGDWIWEMDLDGIHTYSNRAVKDILGYEVDEIVSHDAMEIWPEKNLTSEEKKRHKETLRSGKGWSGFQAVFAHKDGSSRYLLSSAIPLHDMEGNLYGYRGIDRDITERVRQNVELKESRDRFESIIKTAVEIIFTMDEKGIIKFMSPAVTRILGYSPNEMVEKGPEPFIHPEDLHIISTALERISSEKISSRSLEFRARHKDGGYVWLNTNISPILDDKGDFDTVVAVAQDITSKKENEDRIIQFNDLLKLINKILRHDLTNNLFMIRSSIEQYQLSDEGMWLDSATKKIDLSHELIDQMKSLEAILLKGGDLRPVDVQEAMERIRISYDIPMEIDCPFKVMADDAFYSVMENLIRNAILHGKTDRMEFIGISINEDQVIISAIDHGTGIPVKIRERIFEEAFRYGKTAGTGIGLYIVKRTIQRYNGKISVEETEGGGATFRIILSKA